MKKTYCSKDCQPCHQELHQKIDQILALVKDKTSFDQYISESDAKKRFGRGTTWFYNLRKNGFRYTTLGGEIYYLRKDILKLFEQNTVGDDD